MVTLRIFALLFGMLGPVDSPRTGILVMAHGGDERWNQDVEAVVEPLRARYPIEIAFGMARTSTLREAARRLEEKGADRVAVVRMFISGESFLEQTEYILGLRKELTKPVETATHAEAHAGPGAADHCAEKPEPISSGATFVLSGEGVADSSLIEEILVDRVRSLSKDSSKESVLILAHGPGDDGENERWLSKMRMRTQRLTEIGMFRGIRCETLREDWPDKRVEAERRIREFVENGNKEGGRVIVVPFRVAGFGPYREVLEGLTYVSDGVGFCPHPNMTRWIEQTAKACFARLGNAVAP
jgi:hypothetical protein